VRSSLLARILSHISKKRAEVTAEEISEIGFFFPDLAANRLICVMDRQAQEKSLELVRLRRAAASIFYPPNCSPPCNYEVLLRASAQDVFTAIVIVSATHMTQQSLAMIAPTGRTCLCLFDDDSPALANRNLSTFMHQ